MANSTVNPLSIVSRPLPQYTPDQMEAIPRLGRYREQIVQPLWSTLHSLADEGSFFIATNPTPGTAIAAALNAAVSETAGYYWLLKNNDVQGAPGAKRAYLSYLRLIQGGTVPASATAGHFFLKLDTIPRYTSGGTQLTPVNVNGDANTTSIAQTYAGALTTAAAGASARLLARGVLRSVIPVINDEWILVAGGNEAANSGALSGAAALRMSIAIPPIVLAPQQTLGLQLWFPGNAVTAGTFELEAGWWER